MSLSGILQAYQETVLLSCAGRALRNVNNDSVENVCLIKLLNIWTHFTVDEKYQNVICILEIGHQKASIAHIS